MADKFIEGRPVLLLANGKPGEQAMKGARIQLRDILSAARSHHGLQRIEDVKFAVLEGGGSISIIPREQGVADPHPPPRVAGGATPTSAAAAAVRRWPQAALASVQMPTEEEPTDETGRRGATTAQLRADIDRGATGDKVGGFDPAAAPLGSDDEAAGHPAAPEVVARMRAQEGSRALDSRHANAATPDLQPDGRLNNRRGWLGPVAAGVVAGGGLGALIWVLLAA